MNGNRIFKVLLALALVLATVGLFTPGAPGETFSPLAYQTKVYLRDGGDKLVAADGGEIEMLSGATLDIQDGVTAAINDTLNVDGDIDLDGDGFDVDITAGFSIDGDAASNMTVAGAGIDLTIESEAGEIHIKGDEATATAITLDANDAAGTGITAIVGTAGTFGVTGYIADFNMTGGVSIDADLASNFSASVGDITIDAETGSVNIIGSEANAASIYFDANDTVTSGVDIDTGTTSGLTIDGGPFSVDGTGAFNVNTAAGDITIEAETGSVIIKGDEEVADAILLNAATTVTQGIDINVGSVYGMSVDGGLTDFGSGTYATADGDNDVGIEGDLEVNTSIDLDGTGFDVDISGGFSVDGDSGSNVSTSSGDILVDAETGSVTIVGSEAAADSISLDANDTVTSGLTIVVGSVSGLQIDGGLTDFGSGTYTQADSDGDVGLAGDLEVEGATYMDGGAEVNGTLTLENDGTIVNSQDGVITVTLGITTGRLALDTGNLVIGDNVSPSLTLNGNDAYIEGTLEVDGPVRFDDNVTLGVGTLTLSNDVLIMENGEEISNATDTVIQIGGFLALTEGAVQVMTYGATLTAVASFQPITSTAVITNVVIADGVLAGQILVISNENAADDITILESGSNLQAGGDVVLGGGDKDLITLLWDGAEWIRLAFFDN